MKRGGGDGGGSDELSPLPAGIGGRKGRMGGRGRGENGEGKQRTGRRIHNGKRI